MSTTDTRTEQIEALAKVIYETEPGTELPWEAEAVALLDGPVAAMIAQAERAAAAKALREAADLLSIPTSMSEDVNQTGTRHGSWLRTRADRIEAGQ